MKNYAISILVLGLLSIYSFDAVEFFHFFEWLFDDVTQAQYWVNIFLAIFGSSFLALITSIIGYHTEKRKTMEAFYCTTSRLLKELMKYSADWEDLIKLDYIIKYNDVDKDQWGEQFASIYFVFRNKENTHYIYDKIFSPLDKLNCWVSNEENQKLYRIYIGGGTIPPYKLQYFIDEFEEIVKNKKTYMKEGTRITSFDDEFCGTVKEELDKRYYKLMYGKSKSKKGCEENEQSKN